MPSQPSTRTALSSHVRTPSVTTHFQKLVASGEHSLGVRHAENSVSQPSSQPFAWSREQNVSQAGTGTSSSVVANERAAPPYGSQRSGQTRSDGTHAPLSHVVSRTMDPSTQAQTAIGQPCPDAQALGSGASNTAVPPHEASSTAPKSSADEAMSKGRRVVTPESYEEALQAPTSNRSWYARAVGSPERFVRLMIEGLGSLQLWGLLLQSTLEYGSTFLLQALLLRTMTAERRGRGWNALTWSTAILWAGPLSMIPFAWVTRRSSDPVSAARAILVGVVATAGLVGVSWAGGELISRAFHLAPPTG